MIEFIVGGMHYYCNLRVYELKNKWSYHPRAGVSQSRRERVRQISQVNIKPNRWEEQRDPWHIRRQLELSHQSLHKIPIDYFKSKKNR